MSDINAVPQRKNCTCDECSIYDERGKKNIKHVTL